MNTAALMPGLPKLLAPFVTLSYPADRPSHPDSFPNANYYNVGRLDAFFIVTCIAFFAVARDVCRLLILEPFARWKLLRDARHAKQREAARKAKQKANGRANGIANGNGHAHAADDGDVRISVRERKEMQRKVLRFAEQGWCVIYYVLQWSYGLVSPSS
jgi:acyl-CoA-dependent ceramide synthase